MQDKNGRKTRKTIDQSIKYSEILDGISDSFLMLDHDWRFSYINKRAAADLGVKPEDLLGHNIWEKYPAASNMHFAGACRRAMDNHMPEYLEVCDLASSTWHNLRIYPSRDGISVFGLNIIQHKMD